MTKLLRMSAVLTVMALALVSCSDDVDYELFTKYTYLLNNGWQENIKMPINDDNTVTLPVYFGVNGTTGNNKDITVKLAVDADTLEAYNFDKYKNDTSAYYTMLPAGCFSFDKDSYTIAKGKLNVSATCTIDLEKLKEEASIYNEYVLPIRLTESQGEPVGPSAYSKALYFINLTNDYSGVYAGTGRLKQIGTNYSSDAGGKQLYAISKDECYLYLGNADRSTAHSKKLIAKLHFTDNGTVEMSAISPEIDFQPVSGSYSFKFTQNPNDSRKLSRRTVLNLVCEYTDVTDAYSHVRVRYETTLTMNDDVMKADWPNAVISTDN